MLNKIEIETLAVRFRVNCPNLQHVDTLEAMEKLGLAFMYGVYCGTPHRSKTKRRELRNRIAETLTQKAKAL